MTNPLFGTAVVEGAIGLGRSLIDRMFPDRVRQAAERAEAERALLEIQQSGDIQKMTAALSAIIAEANSSDPWTSRARPSFMYVIYVMILASIPMGVLHAFQPETAQAIAVGMKAWLDAIPEELYWLFGTAYLGYTGFRSYDKKNRVTR